MEKWIAIAGVGTRALNFADGIINRCHEYSELVGLYDLNRARMRGFCRLIGHEVPSFVDFSEMVASTKSQTLVICTTDSTHPELIEMAFGHGLDVIVEKPMAMNRKGIERIRRAEEKYRRKVVVTFNMRFTPYSARLKEILLEKPIGEILTVNAEWFIDRTHGNEYFHRWHGHMAQSGGLLVHKATHDFDLLNWYLDAVPAEVFAWGQLRQFGREGEIRGVRCRDCAHNQTCPAAMKSTLDDNDLNPKSEGNIFKNLFSKRNMKTDISAINAVSTRKSISTIRCTP